MLDCNAGAVPGLASGGFGNRCGRFAGEVASVLLEALGGRGEPLTDLTTRARQDYLTEHRAAIEQIMRTIEPLCLATFADPDAFAGPTSWSYPALLWMHGERGSQ